MTGDYKKERVFTMSNENKNEKKLIFSYFSKERGEKL